MSNRLKALEQKLYESHLKNLLQILESGEEISPAHLREINNFLKMQDIKPADGKNEGLKAFQEKFGNAPFNPDEEEETVRH